MTFKLGQSTVLPVQPYQQQQSITKKISNYVFRFQDQIGQGNFSKVYKGFHQTTNQPVAIKIVELSSVKSPKLQELLFSEIEVIQSLNHPNILKCHQVFKSSHNCYIITQLCNGGDLQSLLNKQKCFNELSAAVYIRQIFKGLLYLCERGIVHRDLKIANIFLHNRICKIADFGFAKYTKNQNFLDLDIGSPLYMSPEGMIDHLYGMKTDVWSFGVIIYELLHGKTPFSYCKSEYQLKKAVLLPLPSNHLRPDLSPEVRNLILKCFTINLNNRPDALNLVNDAYLQKIINYPNQGRNFSSPLSRNQNQLNFQVQNQQKIIASSSSNLNSYPSNSHYLTPNGVSLTKNQELKDNYVSNQPNQLNQQKQGALQFSINSPNRNMNLNGLNGNFYTETNPINKESEASLTSVMQKKLLYSPSIQNHFIPRSNQIIQDQSISNMQPQQKYFLNDHIIMNQSLDQKQKCNSFRVNDNNDKASNSSWSHQNDIKRKFHKASSNQNFNKVQNTLGVSFNKVPYNNTDVNTSMSKDAQNSQNGAFFTSNQKNLYNSRNSSDSMDFSINQSVQARRLPIKQLNFNDQIGSSSKKFGQLIKGERKYDGNLKITVKMDKMPEKPYNQLQPGKTKSYLSYDPNSLNKQALNNSKRPARYSTGQNEPIHYGLAANQSLKQLINHSFNQPINQSYQTIDYPNTNKSYTSISGNKIQSPELIFQKQPYRQQIPRNVIFTVIYFKQAVGFLHYCRLYFRFITTFRKLLSYSAQTQKSQPIGGRINGFLSFNEDKIYVYAKFLLSLLDQLIQHIKSKEIIYDGDNPKKNNVKEDKLKQVTAEYFKKYFQEINRNRPQNKRIVPSHDKSTKIQAIKQTNEQFWQDIDREWCSLTPLYKRDPSMNQSLLKNFTNLCYLSIRLVEANQIVAKSVQIKNYNSLASALIQNWLTQQFYTQDAYFKQKNEYFRRINESSTLKNSLTNDTEDNSPHEHF